MVQGERELVDDCRSLARFKLSGLPPLPAGMARVEVSFVVDADGILKVAAREIHTGLETFVEVKPTYGLSDAQIEKMLQDSIEHAEADVTKRMLLEARTEADRVLNALEPALERDADVLPPADRERIVKAAANVRAVMKGDQHRPILEALEKLDAESAEFAKQRMDKAIHAAVAGKRIDDVAT